MHIGRFLSRLCSAEGRSSQTSSSLLPSQEKVDPSSKLPPEIMKVIFSYLTTGNELRKCMLVSKNWHSVALSQDLWKTLNLRDLSPLLKIFNQSDWRESRLTLEAPEVKGIPFPSISDLRNLLTYLRNTRNPRQGITLLTIPEGLTLEKWVYFIQKWPALNSLNIPELVYELKEHSVDPVDKTYRILITHDVLNESLDELNEKELMPSLKCKPATVLELVTLIIISYINNKLYHYHESYQYIGQLYKSRDTLCCKSIGEEPTLRLGGQDDNPPVHFSIGLRHHTNTKMAAVWRFAAK